MQDERDAHAQLVVQWPQFSPADKTHCLSLSTAGGDPTYTELLSCLQVARDARRFERRDESGTDVGKGAPSAGAPQR
jgi:hypothetical protein